MKGVRGDYVLGTHDEEVRRLGVQHRAWRETVLDGWRRAGLRPGQRVLDVGAGPGWATWDLAEAVGPRGRVVAVERAERFLRVLGAERERRGLDHVAVVPHRGAVHTVPYGEIRAITLQRQAGGSYAVSVVSER